MPHLPPISAEGGEMKYLHLQHWRICVRPNLQQWFEESWTVREESLYRALFGDIGPGIYPLDSELFASAFHQESIHPRWLIHGVFECPPSDVRPNWLYVSSGLSNAWQADPSKPDEISGLGCEFIFECPQQSRWALALLRRMVAL